MTARFGLLTLLDMVTGQINPTATASTICREPCHVVRGFAPIDHLSRGRVAWDTIATSCARTADRFSKAHPRHDECCAVAEEFADVVRRLWDRPEIDAVRLACLDRRGDHGSIVRRRCCRSGLGGDLQTRAVWRSFRFGRSDPDYDRHPLMPASGCCGLGRSDGLLDVVALLAGKVLRDFRRPETRPAYRVATSSLTWPRCASRRGSVSFAKPTSS